MAYYGLKLGLLRAIAEARRRPHARRAGGAHGLDARYLRAWARTALAGELLEYDAADGRFTMAPFMDALLLDDDGLPVLRPASSRTSPSSRGWPTASRSASRRGEGIPFADYGQEMVETIHAFSKAAYELFLPSVLLPELPELDAAARGGRHDPGAGLRRRRGAGLARAHVPALHRHRARPRSDVDRARPRNASRRPGSASTSMPRRCAAKT